jgi:hypothetical protein
LIGLIITFQSNKRLRARFPINQSSTGGRINNKRRFHPSIEEARHAVI